MTTREFRKDCAAGTCWADTKSLDAPCQYGHVGCSYFDGGPCLDEHLGRFHDEIDDDTPAA